MKRKSSLRIFSVTLLASGLLLAGCAGNIPTSSSLSSNTPASSSPSSEVQPIVVTITGDDTVVMGKTVALVASVSNTSDTAVNWESSNTAIATVDATGLVTGVDVGTVTITATSVADSSKRAERTLIVSDKYAFRISQNGEYDVEAEKLDFSNATLRSDLANAGLGFIETPTGDAASLTSGGESIRGLVNPSLLTISFFATKSVAVDLKGRFANYDENFSLDNNVVFELDGTSLGKTGAVFGGHSSATDYWPWQDIEIAKFFVKAGEHVLTIDVTKALPNTDCFKFIASEYDATSQCISIAGNGVSTVEAENLDLTNLIIRSDLAAAGRTKESLIEEATDASNGKSIGGIGAGTVLSFNFFLKNEAIVDFAARMADYDDTYNIDASLQFKVDQTTITSNGYQSFGHTDDNLYWNWKNIDLGKLTLTTGFHTFTYTAIKDGINLDAFLLTTSYYGEVSKAGVQLTGNGNFVVEGESLEATNGSYTIENPSGDAAISTSGGASIGNVATGTVFSIPFTLTKKATIVISAKMAKYEDSWDLDSNVTIAIDGMTITTGYSSFGHTDDNSYWNWKDVLLERASFSSGSHTLTLTATNGFPNLDCLNFFVTGFDDAFSANQTGSYLVEGESLNTSALTNDGSKSLIESDSRDSGGESLGHITGGYFDIPFYLESKATVAITCVLSKYESFVIGEKYTVEIDGTDAAFVDPTLALGKAADGSNDWYNWKDCAVTPMALESGEHIFRFNLVQAGVNVDCIRFAVGNFNV